MKNLNSGLTKLPYIGLLLVFLAMAQVAAVAQGVDEHVVLTTDRTHYFVGDPICYSAVVSDQLPVSSQVLYVELINDRGFSVLKQKAAIVDGTSTGAIEVPSEIISGRFVLRAYTRLQRNEGPTQWASHRITIVNPSLASQQNASPTTAPPEVLAIPSLRYEHGGFSWKMNAGNGPWSMSVVKGGLIQSQDFNVQANDEKAVSKTEFLPESRGTVVSGTLVNASNKQPVADVMVYATVLGNQRQFHVQRTDSIGQFAFNFPRLRGEHKVYLCAQFNDVALEYRVSDPFDQRAPYEWKEAPIDSAQWEQIQKAYRHHQMAMSADQQLIVLPQNGIQAMPEPFPTPTERVVLEDYIKLPSVEEAIKEIVPQAYTRIEKGKRTIHMYDRKTKAAFTNALVMVDNLPYPDHSVVFDIPLHQIERFDIYAEPMQYGDITIKGVLNIITKDGLLGGLALPQNGVVIDFPFPAEKVLFEVEKGNDQAVPLLLNTVHFQPFNQAPMPNVLQVGDLVPGTYQVLITILDANGLPKTYLQAINVSASTEQ